MAASPSSTGCRTPRASPSFNNLIEDCKIEQHGRRSTSPKHAASMGAHRRDRAARSATSKQAFAPRQEGRPHHRHRHQGPDAYQWTPGDAWWEVGVPEVIDPQGSPRRPRRVREGQGEAAGRRLANSESAVGNGDTTADSLLADSHSLFQTREHPHARPNQTRRRADRLVEQRPAASSAATRRSRPASRRAGRPASPAPRPASSSRWTRRSSGRSSRSTSLKLVSGWFSGELLNSTVKAEQERMMAQIDTYKALGAPVLGLCRDHRHACRTRWTRRSPRARGCRSPSSPPMAGSSPSSPSGWPTTACP